MPLNNPIPGGNMLSEYIAPGWPYLTASSVAASTTKSHRFGTVGSSFALKNATTGSDEAMVLAYGFTRNGVQGSNRGTLVPGESFSGDYRFTEFFVMSVTTSSINYELAVSLTGIPSQQLIAITGSNGFDGVG